MNFWEARQLAMLGENVRLKTEPLKVYDKLDFEKPNKTWTNLDIAEPWEIVYEEISINQKQFLEALETAKSQSRLINHDGVYYYHEIFERLEKELFRKPHE